MADAKMRYVADDGVGAATGLAADEWLMHTFHSEGEAAEAVALRLYTYRDHCALIGRFQHLEAEIDLDFCRKAGIEWSRRLTGGGAILMGSKQLGICLVQPLPAGCNTRQLYRRFAKPLIDVLERWGIRARFRGKNDLEVAGRKIAGLGIYTDRQGVLQFHASLLLDMDLELMLRVLKVPLEKLSDKSLQRVRARITTVSAECGRAVAVDELRPLLASAYAHALGLDLQQRPFSEVETATIRRLAAQKYGHEQWLRQYTPQPDMTGEGVKKTAAGLLRAFVALKGQTFKSLLITGDFFELEPLLRDLESMLKWQPVDKVVIRRAVEKVLAAHAGRAPGLAAEELVALLWRAAVSAMKEVHYHYEGGCYERIGLRHTLAGTSPQS